MARYYDYVLGLIPLALIGVAGSLHVAGIPLSTAVPLAATVSVGIMGHAMFVRAPVEVPARISPADSAD